MSGVQALWSLVSGIAAAGSMVAFETVTAPNGVTYRAVECHDVMSTYPVAGGSDDLDAALSTSLSCQCRGDIVAYNSTCEYSGKSLFLGLFWLASLTWGGAVFQNVVAATVTGSVASWWFSPGDTQPVRGAFHRATTTSFG